MSIKTRLDKLEKSLGVNEINVAKELTRLKALRKAGKSPPRRTLEDYKKLIAECDNPKLCKLYKASLKAEFN